MKLTVYYDGQYWVGVVEHVDSARLRACRFIFGAEPKDGEVLDFVLHRLLPGLDNRKASVEVQEAVPTKVNPKRLARQVAKELRTKGPSTYAQEAIKLEWETRKAEKKVAGRKQKLERLEQKWQRKVQKAKEKHRGK
ncbi:YjdF family protein [Brevibacillus agri]|uniref:YjdF family protein n=1 Tax=Brevibacillus agri TaxID=51101 RepID=UPI0004719E93|nr:YjdF family protein [Brevibacillus agri]WHX28364.1 YjdF family protein [Brevibacillus agri]